MNSRGATGFKNCETRTERSLAACLLGTIIAGSYWYLSSGAAPTSSSWSSRNYAPRLSPASPDMITISNPINSQAVG
jgi:hypothetical protein